MKWSVLLEPIKVIFGWLCIVASALFFVSAVVMYPVVLSKLTDNWWWLLGYGAYAVVLWVVYKIFWD